MFYSIIWSLFNKRSIDPEPDLYDDEKIYNFLNILDAVDNMDICNTDYLLCNEKNEAIEFKYNVCWNEGVISSEFPYLSNLETLGITGSYNNFCLKDKSIPENIFDLPKLKKLNLNAFKNTDIPININTKSLINSIEFTNSSLEEFPTQLVKLQNLKTLNIEKTIIDHIPKEFAEFPSLESLTLEGNTYKNKQLVIPNKIQYLDVSNEGFTSIFKDNYEKELLSFVCENTISNNNDNFNEDIFDNLANYKKLKYLNLKNNSLIRKIPSSIKELTSLENMDLDYTNINEVSGEYFKLDKLKKRLVLRNKISNSENLATYKPCENNNETNTPCFEISEENDNSGTLKNIGIIASIVISFSAILGICWLIYMKFKKRNKFEKIRKKIIDDVINEVEKSDSLNNSNDLYDGNHNNRDDNNGSNNRNNTNYQVNLIIDDEIPSNNDITNVELQTNNNRIININDPTITNSRDVSESNVTLPTYMESISNSNNSYYLRMAQSLDRKLSPPRTEDSKKELSDNIVDAEVIVPTPMEYYEERLHRKILIENRRNAMNHTLNNNDSNNELQIDDDKHSFSNLTNENVTSRIEGNNDTEISNSYSIDNNNENETEHIVVADNNNETEHIVVADNNNETEHIVVADNNNETEHIVIADNNNENGEIIVNEGNDGKLFISNVFDNNSSEKEFSEKDIQSTQEPNNNISLIKDTKEPIDLSEESNSYTFNSNKQDNDFTEKSNVDASSITDAKEINNNINNGLIKNQNNSIIKTNSNKNNKNINLTVNNEGEYLSVYPTNSLANNNIQHKISQNDLDNKSISEKSVVTKSVNSTSDDSDITNEAEEIIIKDDNNDNKQLNN